MLRIESFQMVPSNVILDTIEIREKPKWWVDDEGAEASPGLYIYSEKVDLVRQKK